MKLRHALAGTVALPLALAVASTASAANIYSSDSTEVSSYGRIQLNLENWDGDNKFTNGNGASRLGFSGATELDNGMKAFANVELRFDATERKTSDVISDIRNTFVGIEGDFGRVTVGNFHSVIYQNVTSAADIAKGQGTSFGFVNGALDNAVGNSIAYQTTDLNGFTAGFAVQHTEETATQDEEFNVQAWAKYQISPDMSIAFGFDQNNEDSAPPAPAALHADGEPIISGNFVFTGIENTVLGALFETTELGGERLIHVGAVGVHNLGSSNIYGVLSYLDWDTGEENGFQAMLGADHHMSSNFLVFAEAAFATDELLNTMGGGIGNSEDQVNLAVGARFHW